MDANLRALIDTLRARLHEPAGGDPVVASVPTSGSTGRPRTVLLPRSAVTASVHATHQRLGGPGSWVLALPSEHVAGLQVVLRSLVADTSVVAVPPGGVHLRGVLDAALDRLPAGRAYVSLVPTQLARLVDSADVDALRRLDAVLVGGAPTDERLLRRARGSGVRVVTSYGMTETCGGCVYDGVPLREAHVRVRLDGDGRIHLGGDVLARGYLDDPVATESAFSTDAEGRRWFRTDDHGAWHDDRLVVLGRLDDVIVTGGRKVAPAAVEAALLGHTGVHAACVVGLPDKQWGHVVGAALVAGAGPQPGDDELAALVRDRVGAVLRHVAWLDELPLRGPGKPDRAAVLALLTRRRTGRGGSRT